MARDNLGFPEAVLKLAGEPQPATPKPPLGPIVAEYSIPARMAYTASGDDATTPRISGPGIVAPDGSWKMGEGGEKMPLYRLPELLAADPSRWVLIPRGRERR